MPVGSKWTDIWQTEWHKEHADVMGFPKGTPLDEPAKLAAYHWPDPDDERICGPIYQQAEAFAGGDCFLAGSHRDTLWEKSYMLVGMEHMMEYFYDEPQFVREVLHRIMDFQLGIARHYLKAGIELAGLGDDLGTQQSLLLSPAIIEEFLIPEYRRLFDLYRQQGVLIEFHSCGHIEPLIDTFIDLGVDILNPIQATANNLRKLRQATQGKMALAGAISTATIMAGPPEKICSEVRETIQLLGAEGGYFCRPDQGMPFPADHLRAYEEALADYGTY
ncbi:MAG: uroporphyrinogen decarboxylase family protein [Eubacteriales bacterium]|nr:uroporphyrinogen decarboxylase family protein [Eubacteriales bacterium]